MAGRSASVAVFVTVNVVIPAKVTKEQRKLYEALAKLSKEDEVSQERTILEMVKDIFG